MTAHKKQVVVIGASAGGVEALMATLPQLPASYPLPVFVVLHIPTDRESLLPSIFSSRCALPAKEAEDKEQACPGTIYFAPPNYHLMLEKGGFMSLSSEEPVLYSRPSIDMLFESAAEAYGPGVLAVIMTGGNHDGAAGLARIAANGGDVVIQDPAEAAVAAMPQGALAACPSAQIATLSEIAGILQQAGA